MTQGFFNVYEDKARAESYDRLEFSGTYYLAYRDLPGIISRYTRIGRGLDFGCGTGRSTRFLKRLGFNVVGVDIAERMLELARKRDPDGEYRLIPDGDLTELEPGSFDLVLSAFPFDNVPTMEKKVRLFESLRRLLRAGGSIVNLVSSPDIYVNEWASFSTKDFPGNLNAKSGDKVSIVMLDVPDSRPVEDIVWSDEDYHEVYQRAGLYVVETHRPLGRESEPFAWVSETRIAPWVIYVLRATGETVTKVV